MSSFYRGKRILVTGGTGFIGGHLVRRLVQLGAIVRIISRQARERDGVEVLSGDLREAGFARKASRGMDMIFHLAAFGWGLAENLKRPAQLLTQNLLLNTQALEAAFQEGVGRYLYTSSSSIYEGSLETLDDACPWAGEPHPSEREFGWAKRLGEIQCRAYHDQYGLATAIVRPTNPYGPGDSVDPERSHVIPGLIQRVLKGEAPLVVWGSGRAERSFVYVEDLVEGMLLALENAADADPLNLASPETTSIAGLARTILGLCGQGKTDLVFDGSRPDGHPRKIPLVGKARERIGFSAKTPLVEGLKRTIEWYRHVQRS